MRRISIFIIIVLVLIAARVPAATAAGPTPVAVIPFTNLTGDKELNWLGQGVAATLSTKLTAVHALRMVERQEIEAVIKEIAFAQTGMVDEGSAARAGRMIGAQVLVAGEYQQANERLRITARFISVETGAVLQTAEGTGHLKDIFSIQDRLADHFVKALQIQLSPGERQGVAANQTVSLPAYSSFYQGFSAQQTSSGDANAKGKATASEAHFRNALRHDPNFGDAHQALGNVLLGQGNANGAASEFRQAARLQPNSVQPLIGMAQVSMVQHRPQEAAGLLQQAVQMQPGNVQARYELATTLQHVDPSRAAQAWQGYAQVAQPMVSEQKRLPQAQQQIQALYQANPQLGTAPNLIKTGQPTGNQVQQPMGQQPTGQQPTGQQPTGQQPMGQQPTGQQPTGQQPMGQQPMGQQPMGQQPMGQQPTGQQPVTQPQQTVIQQQPTMTIQQTQPTQPNSVPTGNQTRPNQTGQPLPVIQPPQPGGPSGTQTGNRPPGGMQTPTGNPGRPNQTQPGNTAQVPGGPNSPTSGPQAPGGPNSPATGPQAPGGSKTPGSGPQAPTTGPNQPRSTAPQSVPAGPSQPRPTTPQAAPTSPTRPPGVTPTAPQPPPPAPAPR